MVRLHTELAMKKFSDSIGVVNSVDEMLQPADNWSQELKEAKNAYAAEFRLVIVPADMGQDEECVAVPEDESGKQSRDVRSNGSNHGATLDSKNSNCVDTSKSAIFITGTAGQKQRDCRGINHIALAPHCSSVESPSHHNQPNLALGKSYPSI
jgi:hypothetical protein